MINLLGEPDYTGLAIYQGIEEAMKIDGVFIHLYGKKYTKPFRKMGHVTIVNENRDEAIRIARQVQNTIKVIA
jgi:5-(carboxyamino)imidazole ribonucleotide synthase